MSYFILLRLVRGGNYNNDTNAGVFNFNRTTNVGGVNNNNSFRLVMGDYNIRKV